MTEISQASDREMVRLHREACDQLARDDAALAKEQSEVMRLHRDTCEAMSYDMLKIVEDRLEGRLRSLNDFHSTMAAESARFRERQSWHPLEREIAELDDRLAALGVPNTPFVP